MTLLRSLSAAIAAACLAATAGAATLAVEGGRWFDGQRFVPATWYVVEGKLTRRPPARVDVRIDARGARVVPPYADAHNHDMQNAWGIGRRLTAALKDGVFYTAELCANEDVEPFRPLLNRPTTPDVVMANACIGASDGHPLGLLLRSLDPADGAPNLAELRKAYVAVDDAQELARRWPEILERKPDLIKVILIDSHRHAERRGRPELLGRNGLDPALLPDILQRARAAGIRVIAHVDTASDAAVAAQAGVDLLAHLPGYHFAKGLQAADYRLDDDTIQRLARAGTPVIATASVPAVVLGLKDEALAAVQRQQRDNLQRLLAAGVPLLIGSDNPFGGPLDEVAYLDAMQLLPRERLLKSLTMDTPRALYPSRAIGRFEEGAEASFLLLDGDPLADLGALRRIRLAVKQGTVLSLP